MPAAKRRKTTADDDEAAYVPGPCSSSPPPETVARNTRKRKTSAAPKSIAKKTTKSTTTKAATKKTTTTKKPTGKAKHSLPPPRPSNLWHNADVLGEVCSYLGRTDLHMLLTVNKTFYGAAARHLYRVVSVRPHNCNCRPPPGRDAEFAKLYTRAVEFFPHDHKNHYPERLHTPNSDTVILNFDSSLLSSSPRERDKHNRTPSWGNYRCDECPKNPPEPKRVVVRPHSGMLKYYRGGPYVSKSVHLPNGYKNAEKVVHIARFDRNPTYSPDRPVNPKPPVSASPPGKITFVVLPFFWDYGPVIAPYERFLYASWVSPLDRAMVETLVGSAIQNADHQVTIVGLEHANPYAPNEHWNGRKSREAVVRDVASEMFKMLAPRTVSLATWDQAWTQNERDMAWGLIKFRTLHDYLTSNEWGPELDWQLVGRWLNDYDKRERGVLGPSEIQLKELKRLNYQPRRRSRAHVPATVAPDPVSKRAPSDASDSSPEWTDGEDNETDSFMS